MLASRRKEDAVHPEQHRTRLWLQVAEVRAVQRRRGQVARRDRRDCGRYDRQAVAVTSVVALGLPAFLILRNSLFRETETGKGSAGGRTPTQSRVEVEGEPAAPASKSRPPRASSCPRSSESSTWPNGRLPPLQVSPGSVSKLIATLTAEGIVDRDARGAVTNVHRRSLMRRWAQDYGYATTNPDLGYWLATRGLAQVADRAAEQRVWRSGARPRPAGCSAGRISASHGARSPRGTTAMPSGRR